jgi:hypothetical protein
MSNVWSYRAHVTCSLYGKAADLHSQCRWVTFLIFCFWLTLCNPCKSQQVKSNCTARGHLFLPVCYICFRRVYEIAKSDCWFRHICLSVRPSVLPSVRPSVCLSVRMEQIGSYWRHFDEIWYLKIFRKYVENIQGWLNSDMNNEYSTWRPMYVYDSVSLISSQNENYFRQNLWMKTNFFC